MNTTGQDEIEIDLRERFGLLRSRIWIILLAGIIMAGVVGVYNKVLVTPLYTSSTQLYIVNKSQSIASLSLSDLQMGTQLTKDYMILVKSRPVTEQVIKNLGLDMEHEELLDIMTISNQADTRILQISVRYPDAFMAKEIVDQLANVSKKRIAIIMDIEEPNVVEEGYVATKKSSPNTVRNAAIGGLLGVIAAAAIICIRYLMDDTIRSSEDVERYLGLTTLGLIPIEADANFTEAQKKKQRRQHKRSEND